VKKESSNPQITSIANATKKESKKTFSTQSRPKRKKKK
jgi:hypothetical protein